jgi:hypothetical protein
LPGKIARIGELIFEFRIVLRNAADVVHIVHIACLNESRTGDEPVWHENCPMAGVHVQYVPSQKTKSRLNEADRKHLLTHLAMRADKTKTN